MQKGEGMEEIKKLKEAIASSVSQRRHEINMEQEALCDYSGMSITTLSNLENAKANITIEKLGAILNILGLEIEIKVKKTI